MSELPPPSLPAPQPPPSRKGVNWRILGPVIGAVLILGGIFGASNKTDTDSNDASLEAMRLSWNSMSGSEQR
ncbi:MAG: hypothetical protein RJB65_1028, partial [Actinomycetota bacterium]